MDKDFFRDKKILVMGLGRFGGGVDVVKFTCSAGAKVIVTDLAKPEALAESIAQLKDLEIDYHLGSHEPADFQQADIVVANPAVPLDNKFLQIARDAGKRVTSQIELFFEFCPATIIGITGSNGKSTTSSLTAHLLRSRFGDKVWLSGNIGNEPFLTILDPVKFKEFPGLSPRNLFKIPEGRLKPDDLVVLEISSFQIEQLAQSKLAPPVALLTNLTPNHLDRYKTFEHYCDAKQLLFQNQKLDKNHSAISIFNAEDQIARRWFEKYRKQQGRLCIKFSADDVPARVRSAFTLPGRANLSNLAAALAVARYFGVTDEQVIACLPAFKALPHRLQLVAESRGIKWFNDSKATTPESAIVALEAFDNPVVLIAGGYDKHIPFDEFGEKIAQKAKVAILIGQTAQIIAKTITASPQNQPEIKFAKTLAEAVKIANDLAVSEDVVLLSPACASYDMFENYEQRGRLFSDLANNINR
ncbi:MAG: UDP-N-acetylmuramoyl-L-alanine--D-glutamate ligase [Sedimentisphaerales bacterium]